MEIHLLSIIWLILILYSFTRKIEFTIMLTIMSVIFMGTNFITVRGLSVSLFEMSSLFLLVRYILKKRKINIKLDSISKKMAMMTIVIVILTIFSSFVFSGYPVRLYSEYNKVMYAAGIDYVSVDGSLIIALLRLILYTIVFVVIGTCAKQQKDREYLEKMVCKTVVYSLWIVLIVGILQWLNIYGIFDCHSLVEIFHNEGGDAYTLGYDKLYSVFDEPSYCAPWLNAIFWGLIFYNKDFKTKKLLIILTGVEFVLTVSATGGLAFIIMAIYWIIGVKKNKKKMFLVVGGSVFVILTVLLSSQGQRLIFEMLNKMNSMSGISRLTYIKDCYTVFIDTYGIGLGYSQIKCMTLISGLLAQVGIIGTIMFLLFFLSMIRKKISNEYENFTKTILIAVLLGAEISCSGVIYAMPMWFGILLFAFSLNKVNSNNCLGNLVIYRRIK